MQVRDLLHAQPTELSTAHSTRHVIARAVVHLDDESAAAWTQLYFICITSTYHKTVRLPETMLCNSTH